VDAVFGKFAPRCTGNDRGWGATGARCRGKEFPARRFAATLGHSFHAGQPLVAGARQGTRVSAGRAAKAAA